MADLSGVLRPHVRSEVLRARVQLPLRDLDWPTCDDCGCGSGVLARATEDGGVYDFTHGVCLECGAVLCAHVDEDGVEWVVCWVADGYDTEKVGAVALAAARRVAGWPRALWWRGA